MKDRTIIIIFGLLILIYLATRMIPAKRDLAFSADLIHIDTAQVSSILIQPPLDQAEISLLREGNKWLASNGQTNIVALPAVMDTLLGAFAHVKTIKVATQKPSDWADYQVDEQNGIRIRVYQGQHLLEDFMVGKTEATPVGNKCCYVRLSMAREVYAVDASIAPNIRRDFSAFRNRLIINLESKNTITYLDWQTPDTLLQLQHTDQGWMLGEQKLDSLPMENYLRGLRKVEGDTFADDFDEVESENLLFRVIMLNEDHVSEPIIIRCYRDTLRSLPFIIHSNQNKDAYFSSDSLGAYRKIFGKFEALLFK